MRRAILLLAMMGLGLMLIAGVALAATFTCATSCTGTNTNDTINGTTNNNNIAGGGGTDIITGGSGVDRLFGDFGNADSLSGGPQNDLLNVSDAGAGDRVSGGQDTDFCLVDPGDLIDGQSVTSADDTDLSGTGIGTCEFVEVLG